MSLPQLGYKYGRPLFSSAERREAGGGASLSGVLTGMYGAPFAGAHGYSAFLPYSDLAILNQLGSQYEFKDSPGLTHTGFPHASFYPYGHQYQFGDPSRPKNATRESTSTLKAWLSEHRKNPYPTKGEKIMLAIITKMTLTQVSTWFANARRRLKKENKMTWVPKTRTDEDGNVYTSDNEDKRDEDEEIDLENIDTEDMEDKQDYQDDEKTEAKASDSEEYDEEKSFLKQEEMRKSPDVRDETNNMSPPQKPKIWSLAETAAAPDGPRKTWTHEARSPINVQNWTKMAFSAHQLALSGHYLGLKQTGHGQMRHTELRTHSL